MVLITPILMRKTESVVMFSGGAVSWGTAKRAAARMPDRLTLLFCDTSTEDPDTYRFVREGAANVGGDLVWLKDGRDVWDVMRDERMIGNSRIAPCSRSLKQLPARRWVKANCDPAVTTLYVGLDWTEAHRVEPVRRNWAPWPVALPLVEEKPYLSKPDIIDWIRAEGLTPPLAYAEGRPHNNCGGFCVRAGQGEFARLFRQHPDRYAYHERREGEMRELLGDVAILRDRGGGGTRPLPMAEFRERLVAGDDQLDLFDSGGCGCFTADNPPINTDSREQP